MLRKVLGLKVRDSLGSNVVFADAAGFSEDEPLCFMVGPVLGSTSSDLRRITTTKDESLTLESSDDFGISLRCHRPTQRKIAMHAGPNRQGWACWPETLDGIASPQHHHHWPHSVDGPTLSPQHRRRPKSAERRGGRSRHHHAGKPTPSRLGAAGAIA